MIIWLIVLSGSGKSTIGKALYDALKPRHRNLVFVDGDEFREIMGNDIGFSYEERRRNARRFSHFCRFLDSRRSKVRARVEHVFCFQESSMGGKLVRTIGIAGAGTKIGMVNLVYNMRRFFWLTRNGIRAP